MFNLIKNFSKNEILYPRYNAKQKWALMKCVDIIINDELYMRRLMIFKCPLFSLYLHKFFKGDDDRCPHDHPWAFLTFILTHGYKEEVGGQIFFRKPLRLYYRPAEWLHRVIIEEDDPKPITFVITGKKVREWGFLTTLKGWVHWKDFQKEGGSHLC